MAAQSYSTDRERFAAVSARSVPGKYQTVMKCSKSGVNPCASRTPKIKEKEARFEQRRNQLGKLKTFRHLPMESIEFHNEEIQLDVDSTNRAALRMEYLMGSTMVNLNDSSYMKKLHAALLEAEEVEYQKTVKARQMKEIQRVKKLVLNGEMLPPPGMESLYKHPVFRVTQMLKRLDNFDRSLLVETKPEHKIVPVEPFEYDSGGKYFVHLHKYGNHNYLPREVARANRVKRKAKIQRARERLKAQQEEDERRANPELNTIFKRPEPDSSISNLNLNEKDSQSHIKIKFSLALDVEKNSSSDSPPNETEEEALARKEMSRKRRQLRLDRAQQEKDEIEFALLFQEREHQIAEAKILREKEKEEAREEKERKIEWLQQEQDREYMQMLEKKNKERAQMDPRLAAILDKLSIASIDPEQNAVEESPSQKYFRQFYKVPPLVNLERYKPYDNPLVKRIDDSDMEDPGLFISYCQEVKSVYDREQAKTDDFLKKGLPQSNI